MLWHELRSTNLYFISVVVNYIDLVNRQKHFLKELESQDLSFEDRRLAAEKVTAPWYSISENRPFFTVTTDNFTPSACSLHAGLPRPPNFAEHSQANQWLCGPGDAPYMSMPSSSIRTCFLARPIVQDFVLGEHP